MSIPEYTHPLLDMFGEPLAVNDRVRVAGSHLTGTSTEGIITEVYLIGPMFPHNPINVCVATDTGQTLTLRSIEVVKLKTVNMSLCDAIHQPISVGDYVLVGFPINMKNIHQVTGTFYTNVIVGEGSTSEQYPSTQVLVITQQLQTL